MNGDKEAKRLKKELKRQKRHKEEVLKHLGIEEKDIPDPTPEQKEIAELQATVEELKLRVFMAGVKDELLETLIAQFEEQGLE